MVRTAYGWLRSRGGRPSCRRPTPPPHGGRGRGARGSGRAGAGELGRPAPASRSGNAMEDIEALPGGARSARRRRRAITSRSCAPAAARTRSRPTPSAPTTMRSRASSPGAPRCASTRDHRLLRELLALYDGHYSRLKTDRSGVDFEDLELGARDLLRDEGLGARYRDRFSHVLVDEFQDTNPLQNELLGLIESDNLFRVGDERQSIYGFRHADVGVFRGHAEAAEAEGTLERLTLNFRSRPEILDAIDLAFGRVWDDYEPLRAPGPAESAAARVVAVRRAARDRPPQGPLRRGARRRRSCPSGPTLREATPWRAAEARLLARRIDELTTPRARTTSATWRCCCAPPPTSASTSGARGARHPHLRAGRPRLLEPAAGGRPAGLARGARKPARRAGALLRAGLAAGRRLARRARAAGPAPARLRRTTCGACSTRTGSRPELPEGDRERAERFVELFRDERAAAPRVSLETLIDRAVTAHRLRPRGAVAARGRAPHGQRAQADADGARVRGRGGARPARLHRLRGRARPDPGARGPGAARGGGARRRPAHDDPPRQGPRVPGGVRRRSRQGGPRGRRRAAHLRGGRGWACGSPSLGGGSIDSDKLKADQGAAQARGRGGGEADLLRGRDPRPGAPGAERRDRPREARGGEAARGADALDLALFAPALPDLGARRRGRRLLRRAGASACAAPCCARQTSTCCCPPADREPGARRTRGAGAPIAARPELAAGGGARARSR